MSAKTVISLLPSATEIIYALGLGDHLIGRSHECDFPVEATALPVCTSANIADGLSSVQIDSQVKELLTNALSVYSINKELIRDLQPDVIITQDQCKACAVSLSDVEEALKGYLDKPVEIISLQPNSLNDIFTDIQTIADKLNVRAKGEQLIEDLQERVDIIRHKVKFMESKPTVTCIEWLKPLMISGNWTPELVTLAGGVPLLATAGTHSEYADWDAIAAADADVMILMPCGFSIERTMREIELLLAQQGFADLKAVKNNRVYIADGNNYFNRPGPRIVDSLEMLAEMIYPKQFIFGYEGNGWIKFAL